MNRQSAISHINMLRRFGATDIRVIVDDAVVSISQSDDPNIVIRAADIDDDIFKVHAPDNAENAAYMNIMRR